LTPRVIAVCGKGGVGKTTVSAITSHELFRRKDRRALIIDADPAGGLQMALHFPEGTSINQVRVETINEIKKKNRDKKDLARGIDYMLARALIEKGHLAFLSLGRPEEVGCYCSVNTLLQEAIEELSGKFDLTLIDAEAGIEQVNRNVMKAVDYLLLVADTSAKAVKVAETIRRLHLRAPEKERPDCSSIGLIRGRRLRGSKGGRTLTSLAGSLRMRPSESSTAKTFPSSTCPPVRRRKR
jgi:CO dehydrogenase maturation factor